MKKKNGITLVEVLVACGIVAVLAVIVWMAVAPAIKRQAMGNRIRSDLHQIVAAINIYRQDNDEQLPPTLRVLGKDVPRRYPNWNPKISVDGFQGWADYQFSAPLFTLQLAKRYKPKVQWDPEKFAIVDAPFYKRDGDHPGWISFRYPDGTYHWRHGGYCDILGAWLDGRVAWKRFPDEWQQEASNLNMLGFAETNGGRK